MSCNIYCIEDINGLKYVGSTILTLERRLNNHIADKKRERGCSSCHLDLDNCKIYQLEECDISHRKQREKYWINNTDCVNISRSEYDRKKVNKKYREKNKDKIKKQRDENRLLFNENQKTKRHYINSWGGDPRYNNNFLNIDVNLFN